MDASTDEIAPLLLDWYDANARHLPWRLPPGADLPDDPEWPYRVWLSEIMLQQTTVAAVKDYFAEFTRCWPDVGSLAAADEGEVLAAWAGLGYYARARNLIACAREIAGRGGLFPDSETELRALPGLGDYTAAAVAAIGFGRRAVVVDANVERVVARLFAVSEPLPGARRTIRSFADSITPEDRAGDFAQAMMDLGATICLSRAPRCLLCPLSGNCKARAAAEAERFPVKAAKKPKPHRNGTTYWIGRERAGISEVWLVRRQTTGMLGGMRALPDDGWNARTDGHGGGPLEGPWKPGGVVNHTFTHFSLDLKVAVYLGRGSDSLPDDEGEWWPVGRLDEAGLPTLFAKAARHAIACTGEIA